MALGMLKEVGNLISYQMFSFIIIFSTSTWAWTLIRPFISRNSCLVYGLSFKEKELENSSCFVINFCGEGCTELLCNKLLWWGLYGNLSKTILDGYNFYRRQYHRMKISACCSNAFELILMPEVQNVSYIMFRIYWYL